MLSRAFERRAISFQQVFGTGGFFGTSTYSGVSVTQDNSLRISTAYACVRLLADTVSTLPVDSYIRRDGIRTPYRPRPIWLDQPDSDLATSRDEHFTQVMVSLLLDGNAFVRVVRDPVGNVIALIVLDPKRVEVRRNKDFVIEYYIRDIDRVLSKNEVLHITEMRKPGALRGSSRIDELKEVFGLTAALDEFASRFFGQGSQTSGVIEVPGALSREQAKDLVDSFEEGHKGLARSHRPGVLFGGAKFNKTGVDPNEAQMLESRKMQVEEIARAFRVPLHMLSTAIPGAMSYASVEQNAIQFATYTIRPYLSRIEAAYSTLLPQGVFIRFNMDGILRGDIQTRFSAYSTGTQAGFLSVNDIHRLEDLPPVEGGDVYRVPLANVDLAAAALVEQEHRVSMAQKLINVGFDPAETLSALNLPAIAHSGVPSTQLQAVAQIDPNSPESVYGA
ncbi:phage portal protein [bacterium]|nr:phage portal protein [bacterium]